MNEQRIADVCFEGIGCAISTASASMMTVALQGRPRAEVDSLDCAFGTVLAGDSVDATAASLGELIAFTGVHRFPVRVKCARLPWQVMVATLAGS